MSGSSAEDRWRRLYSEVEQLWREGRLAESAALLDIAERECPDEPTVKLSRVQQNVLEDSLGSRPSQAVRSRQLIREAVAPADTGFKPLLTAALLMFDLGDLDSSLEYMRRIRSDIDLLQDDEIAPFSHALGVIGARRGKASAAEDQLRLAFDHDPTTPLYAATLARFLFEQGRMREARDVVQQGLRHCPDDEELLALARSDVSYSSTARVRTRYTHLDTAP